MAGPFHFQYPGMALDHVTQAGIAGAWALCVPMEGGGMLGIEDAV